LARKYHQGLFRPIHPEKYVGDAGNIVFRSSWELRVMSKLDRTPEILRWSSEEICIPYFDPSSGRKRRYFPDFVILAQRKDRRVTMMIEVKPESQTQKPVRGRKRQKTFVNEATTYVTNTAKWEAAREFCRKKDWEFRVVTERDLGI
jgi:hypothetical protein